jgi:hypothetical protein
MTKTLVFVHTAPVNVTTFAQLLAEIDPTIPAKHILDESLLQEARTGGITPQLAERIQQRHLEAMEDAAVVLCTCSTIGGVAERTVAESGQGVIRVDRPMAEAAVALGDNIVVAAALESTIAPTSELILDVAKQQGREVTIRPLLCAGAWQRFEAGDQPGYWASIAQTLRADVQDANTPKTDVIVLAQASMAGAAALCADLPVPILSSPRLGLEAAVRAYRANE